MNRLIFLLDLFHVYCLYVLVQENMHHQQVHDCLFLISQTSLKPIQAILILDADGKRICAKYYNSHYATEKKQLEFEKKLYIKTKNSNTRTDGLHFFLSFFCI